MTPLLLASSSLYRRELLSRLKIPFDWQSPNIDERPHPNETPEALVRRLAQAKAEALSPLAQADQLIIGSDQVAVLGQQILGKPGHFEQAKAQLQAASGQMLSFFTGLAVLNSRTRQVQLEHTVFNVYFRVLSEAEIERYLHLEQPYDCAGSFKAEGLGVSLFHKTEGEDSTSLIGLPLIKLAEFLRKEGINLP